MEYMKKESESEIKKKIMKKIKISSKEKKKKTCINVIFWSLRVSF